MMPDTDDAEPDYYQILGLPHDADWYRLDAAYARLASEYKREFGEDRGALHQAFRRLNEAYGVLVQADSRAAYDRSLGVKGVQAQPRRPRRWRKALRVFDRRR